MGAFTERVELSGPPGRLLLVKPSALGDVVHALPVAMQLKQKWPGMRLSWLVARPFAGLLDHHPAVDEVIAFDRLRGAGAGDVMRASWDLGRQLRERAFDVAIDLQGLYRSGWLTRLSRAPVRIGFRDPKEPTGWAYTHRVGGRRAGRHAIEHNLDVAFALGCEPGPTAFGLDEIGEPVEPAPGSPYAVLLPGTNWVTKRWPADHFSQLAARLQEELGLTPVLAGAADAVDARPAFETRPTLDLVGRTTLPQLVTLLRNATLVVCNDSGPMHLAAALGSPLVSLFGPTDPIRTGPVDAMAGVVRLDIACAPCLSRRCTHRTCLTALPVSTVFDRCRQIVTISPQRPPLP
jgi:lipopolysaccharide heptosyltransferase I